MLKKFLALLLMLCTSLVMAAVDVNKANDAELDSIKGIGPGTSKMILAERKKGHFKDWQDFIDRVKGIGDARAAKLSEAGLTVNGTAYKETSASKKDDKKDTKASAKDDKKDTKASAKDDRKDTKPATTMAAASGAKATASATKAAASTPKAAASAASAKK
jgi:competence protein ComEA